MEEFDITTIGRRSVHSILALISRSFILYLISFGAFLLMSSVFLTIDVGIYTVVTAMQRVISFFADFGLGAALVQKKDKLSQNDLATSFTIQASITFFIFFLVVLLREPISSFFKLPEVGVRLLMVLVFSLCLSSFKMIPSILLERNIRFEKLIIPQIIESLTFNFIFVVLVIKGFGIDSYSWAFLISGLAGIPVYYYISPWRLTIGIDRESLKHLKFGLQFQAKNILATVKDDLLTVILIKFLSFVEIGYIGFAQRLAFFMYRFIVDSVTKVTFSTYARIQDDKERLKKAIENSLFYVSAVMFPLLSGLIAIAPYIVQYFPKWHNKWEPALVSLTFFCLNAIVSSLSGILVNVLDSTGRVKTTLKLMILWTTLIWILTPLLIVQYGYNGVSIASFFVTLTIFVTIYLVKRIIDFAFIKSVYKPFISSLIMISAVYLGLIFVNNSISLLLVVFGAGTLYILLIYSVAKKELQEGIRTVIIKS